jgi:hypothetical protein
MSKDWGAVIAEELANEFASYKSAANDPITDSQWRMDGMAISRRAMFTMQTGELGEIEYDMVCCQDGSLFMRTQQSHAVRVIELDNDTLSTGKLFNGIKCYIDENLAFAGEGDITFSGVEFSNVIGQIAMERQPSGDYEPVLVSVTPVEDEPSAPAP